MRLHGDGSVFYLCLHGSRSGSDPLLYACVSNSREILNSEMKVHFQKQKQTTNMATAPEKLRKVQFSWTEEETALLLKVVADYKVSKLSGGQDWETVRTKYDDITSRFQASYPVETGE